MRILIAGLLIAIAVAAKLTAPAAAQDIDAEALAQVIAKKTKQLQLPPHTTESISEKALRVQNAIKSGDYDTALSISAALLQQSELQNWRYYPFTDFIDKVSDVADPAFASRLDDWVKQNPGAALPTLIRAKYDYDEGWTKRGNEFAQKTSDAQFAEFRKYMNRAKDDIDQAIILDPKNPYSYYLRTIIARGVSQSATIHSFEDAIRKFPSYYSLYDIMLNTLQPRWYGDYAIMQSFVDQYAESAPNASPLRMLYFSLYRYFLSSASISCSRGKDKDDVLSRCVENEMAKLISPELDRNVDTALHLYDQTDQHQYRVYMYRLVSQMQEVSGGDALSGAMLARAATAMHTDTRRQASHAHNSDYAIDELAGDLWWRKGYASTALIKYQEALKDANERKFPNEPERDEALSHIYTELARFSNRVNAHTDVIVYKQAAVALGDTSEEEYICYGYYNLKHFTEAVHSCTTAMNRKENWYALFWRGMAYAELGQIDLAVQDIAKVSESTSSFHSRAVDELILLHLNHNHHRQAIDIYAQHPELFDEKRQSRATLAQNFNNRCYGYMELGELQKALDDCNRSIGFGGLPDTFIKQQELRRRLNQ